MESNPIKKVIEKCKPTELEINLCYAKLNLFAEKKDVPNKFQHIFGPNTSAADIGIFVNLLRDDLGYKNGDFDPEKYPYIFDTL